MVVNGDSVDDDDDVMFFDVDTRLFRRVCGVAAGERMEIEGVSGENVRSLTSGGVSV